MGEWRGVARGGRWAVVVVDPSTNLQLRLAVPLDRLERHVWKG